MIEFGLLHIGSFFIGLEFVLLILFVVVAAIHDIASRRIPNWLILAGLFTSLIYQTASGYGYGLNFWLIGLAVGFALFLPLYLVRAMGAGDVKLIALVGSFVGGVAAFQIVVLTLLAGGVLALAVMFWNRSWRRVYENVLAMTLNMTMVALARQLPKAEAPIQSAGNLPYGVAIATGTFLYICFFRP